MPDMLNNREIIQPLSIEEELKGSYLTYALSVIMARALPDVRDGLKPSQRRVLIAMNDLGLSPGSKYRKSAKICGDTSGNYHPHGESIVYPTMVRMAQTFSVRYTLVDGQGNFGSIDGDPPAAMRYTEARLTKISMEVLQDLKLDTVDFAPNYDETRLEPKVLPGKFPNLLCNGASGIAVGMATNIPPHNLVEIADATIRIIDEPDIGIDELIDIVQGPDFPTGGIICGMRGIRQAYKTGRGQITLRARVAIEELKNDKCNILVTEIPYQINKTTLIERIAGLVKKGTIKSIADIRDESDKEGMRIVVELKRGEDPNVALNLLFKHTELQTTYGAILLAIENGQPRTFNLKQMLSCYIGHRIEVIERRTRFLLDKAEKRAHILEGLLIALGNIDAVIEVIKKSPDVNTARQNLVSKFKLTEVQAVAILEMRLQRLTGLEVKKIREELADMVEKIKEYKAILGDRDLVLDIIKEDLHELKDKYADDRRTEIVPNEAEQFDIEDLIAEEDVAVTISHEGYIKRLPLTTYRKQRRGGKGVTGAHRKEGDFIEYLFVASTHDYILFFTDHGKAYWLKVYDIPQMSRISKGRALINMLEFGKDEKIAGMIPVRHFDDRNLVMATANGVIKKTPLEAFSRPKRGGIIAINLDENDKLIGASITTGSQGLILGTRLGQCIRFSENELRPMGRATRGVRGITLKKGDVVKDLIVTEQDGCLLTVCEHGYGKKTAFSEYREQKRGGLGVINIRTTERNGSVVGMKPINDGDELMLISANSMVVRIAVSEIRTIGRATQGVRLININEDDRLVGIARVVQEESDEETAEE